MEEAAKAVQSAIATEEEKVKRQRHTLIDRLLALIKQKQVLQWEIDQQPVRQRRLQGIETEINQVQRELYRPPE